MRIGKFLGSMVAASFAVALVTASSPAHADDEFDVAVSGNTITVTAKGQWHVNKDYPWKVGDKKKDAFQFTETKATASGLPKGAVKLKGGVCSGDKCKNFEKEVTIN